MFKEIKRNGTNPNGYTTFKIIDDDFEEIMPVIWGHYPIFCENFIRIYQRRGLNIGGNTALFLRYVDVIFDYDIKVDQIILNNPGKLLNQYKEEVEKYLLLL